MALDPVMNNELRGPSPMVTHLIRIELLERPILIYDGPGAIYHQGDVYLGEDPDFGVLDNIETLVEQIGIEAPTAEFSFLPNNLTAMATLTSPINQGSPVSIWLGTIDDESGTIVGVPELLFVGELDTAEVLISEDSTVITFEVASAWERFFEINEGQRLNNSFIQSIWPGARGAEFISQIQREEPWGYDGPRPAIVADVIGGSQGGGGQTPNLGGGTGGGTGGGGGPSRGGGGGYNQADMV